MSTTDSTRAAVEAWMREGCPHSGIAAGAGSRKYECPDCLLAFAAAQRAEEREACARMAENPYGDEVQAMGGRKYGDEPGAVGKKIATAIRARREGPGGEK